MKKTGNPITTANITRDHYIDFLRAFGLLLLVIAHTTPPEWLKAIRAFDVPMMVFISTICYKPLRGGYLAYAIKRFKRIYIPVFTFLTLFFIAESICYLILGKPHLRLTTVIGSYFLLLRPSIGYVWIMRVFLLIALVLPLLYNIFKNSGALATCISAFALIIIQHYISMAVDLIDNKILHYVVRETIPYIIGYSAIAIIGLKIREFSRTALLILLTISVAAVIGFVLTHDMTFYPQQYKYPPQSLYILYGIAGSTLMWSLKPILEHVTISKVFTFLSENSMWLYLWHIIPVYAISPISGMPNLWFGRYCIVICGMLLLFMIYSRASKIISRLRLTT